MIRNTYFSWIALLAAILAWTAVIFFAWTISSQHEARTSSDSDSEQASVQQSVALRVHSLARETSPARAELEGLVSTDIVSIVDTIDAVGHDAGVQIQIGQALAAPSSGPGSIVHTVSFIVEAEGSFASVAHAAALLGSLPTPSAVDQLQFERAPSTEDSAKGSPHWRMSARMRFFTTADTSS